MYNSTLKEDNHRNVINAHGSWIHIEHTPHFFAFYPRRKVSSRPKSIGGRPSSKLGEYFVEIDALKRNWLTWVVLSS